MNSKESISLSPDEESALNTWMHTIDDRDMESFDDGSGGYLNINQIEAEIRSGTHLGRDFLKTILSLSKQKE